YALERYAYLKAVKESETRYRTVFESSRDMIFISDEKGNIINCNDSATRIFGYSKEELINSPFSVLCYNEREEQAFLDALRQTGTITNQELTLKDMEGEKKYCLISASL